MAKIDMGGVENVSVALVKQARNDFIKGAKILYKHLKTIPTHVELLKNMTYKTLSNLKEIRWMYDAWRFVKNDPYEMFGEVGEERIIKDWSEYAIIDYYKDKYLLGATILYILKAKNKKEIYELADSSIYKKMSNKEIADGFIESRNHMLSLPNGVELMDKWNAIAYERAKKSEKDKDNKYNSIIQNKSTSDIIKVNKHKEMVLKAKELFDNGMPREDIAKELGVAKGTVYRYIREIKDINGES